MKYVDYPETEHQTRLMVGDPVAEAYEWIKRYAESLPDVSFEELVKTAESNLKDDYTSDINRGSELEGVSVDPLFWNKLAILMRKNIPQEKRNNFFSCSC